MSLNKTLAYITVVLVLAATCFIQGCSSAPSTDESSDGWQVFDAEPEIPAEDPIEELAPVLEESLPVQSIMIYITGEVQNPGVYELDPGSRVINALNAAGGATSDAALETINLSERIEDEDHITIPTLGEDPPQELIERVAAKDNDDFSITRTYISNDHVNINTATSEELQTLSGIGPVTASKIIAYRKANGGFKTIEDIKNVDRIGEKTFESLKDYITVD